MRKTLTNLFLLIAFPIMLLPIFLGAADSLEAMRMEHYFQVRLEHLRSLARDRHRRAERARLRDREHAARQTARGQSFHWESRLEP
jgi:hypothetical protein